MDLILLLALVIGTNVCTYALAVFICMQDLKRMRIYPIVMAIADGKIIGLEMSCNVHPEYKEYFDSQMVKYGGKIRESHE